MTDRDLFYCGDLWCDGHARSNEKCSDLYCDVDPEECEPVETKPVAPKITVSGNVISVQRLDEHGNPVGAFIPLDESLTNVTFDLPEDAQVVDAEVNTDFTFKSMTLDFTLTDVGPELLALLTGGLPPKRPWYVRAWRRIMRWQWTIIFTLFMGAALVLGVWWIAFLWGRLTR